MGPLLLNFTRYLLFLPLVVLAFHQLAPRGRALYRVGVLDHRIPDVRRGEN